MDKKPTKNTKEAFRIIANTTKYKTYKLATNKPQFISKQKPVAITKDKEIQNDKILEKLKAKKKEEIKQPHQTADCIQDLTHLVSLKKEKENLENEDNKLKEAMEALRKNEIELKKKLDQKKESNKNQRAKLSEMKSDKENLKKKLEDLKHQLENLENEEENNENINNDNIENNTENSNNNEAPIDIGELFSRLHLLADLEENESRGISQENLDTLPITVFKDRFSEIKCVLCRFELCYNDEIIILPKCSHKFHKACLFGYANNNDTCPTCHEKII